MSDSDSTAIADLRKKHIDAFNATDLESMATVATDDVVVMPPNMPAFTGKDAARAWWQKGFELARSHFGFTPTELVVSGDWAIDRFAFTMETTPKSGGEGTRDNGDCIWIWRKEPHGEWRIARAIWNSDNETPGLWSGASRS